MGMQAYIKIQALQVKKKQLIGLDPAPHLPGP